MDNSTCSVSGCGKPRLVAKTGYCSMHDSRMRRYGTLERKTAASVAERLERYVDRSGECWMWMGTLNAQTGYGNISVSGGQTTAHRASYEYYVGPIPDGLHIDHLCRNRACVRPDHLEPVTSGENTRRGLQGFALTGMCKAQLHDMAVPTNIVQNANGSRQCRLCLREVWKRQGAKKYAKRKAGRS